MKGWRFLHRGSDAFWVGAVPTGWPRPQWWTDLSTGWVIDNGRGGQIEDRKAPDEVLYLPPVPVGTSAARERSLATWSQAGARTVMQVEAGVGGVSAYPEGPTVKLWDPTALLISGGVDRLSKPPADAWVLWPVIPAVSEDPGAVRSFADSAAAAGVLGVLPLVPLMSPAARRHIVDHHGSRVFEPLHHGPAPDLAAVARAVAEAGLQFQPPRPARTGESEHHAAACTVLGHLGDLYLRLEQAERGQRILRAQRWLEEAQWDLEVIVRDGHLKLVPEIAGEAEEVLREVLESGTSPRLDRLRSEYLAGGQN